MYRSAFTETDIITSDVAVVSGNYMPIGEYQVQAGEKIALGFGEHTGQDNAEGRLYLDLKDDSTTPVEVNGKIQFAILSPQNRHLETLAEYRTETLRTSSSDRSLQIPFPAIKVLASEDKKIVMYLDADANKTVSATNSSLLMDITVNSN